MMRNKIALLSVWSLALLSAGCVFSEEDFDFDDEFSIDDEEFAEPELDPPRVFDANEGEDGPFSSPFAGLSSSNQQRFERGQELFRLDWPPEQVGPVFNAIACSECHVRDGRGRPDTVGLLFRLSVPGPSPEPTYGDQLQPRGLMAPGEGIVQTRWETSTVVLDDGSEFELRRPRYDFLAPGYGPLDDQFRFSPRLAQQTFGLGLLEAIPEPDILAAADPDDEDGDGISGRPNWVQDVQSESVALGRFGWKAGHPTLEQQNAAAFLGDLGMTSSLFEEGPCTEAQQMCLDAESQDQELSDEQLRLVTRYTRLLAPPERRNSGSEEVLRGEELFSRAACDGCHVAEWVTGDVHLDELSNRTISPYTDLLLHDMGDDLADRRPEASATGREWRTPPLWGIGLLEEVNGHTFLLHDGRARNVVEAILWHGGEATASRDVFAAMSADERDALVSFVESL